MRVWKDIRNIGIATWSDLSNHVHLKNKINSRIIRVLIPQKFPSSWKKKETKSNILLPLFSFSRRGKFLRIWPPYVGTSFDTSTSCLQVFRKVFHYNCRFYSSLKRKSIGKLTKKFLESNYERSMGRYSIPLTLYSDAMNFRQNLINTFNVN